MPLETTQQREHRLKKEHDKRMRELAYVPQSTPLATVPSDTTNVGSIPSPVSESSKVEEKVEETTDGDTSVEEMLEEVIEEITEDEGEDDDV